MEFAVTAHAVERYRTRVALLPPVLAAREIADLLSDARVRATPRHWMRATTGYGSGVRFAYSARAPRVCFVIRGNAVVTVITRSLSRATLPRRPGPERRYERGANQRPGCRRLRGRRQRPPR